MHAIGAAHGNCLLVSRIYQANNPDLQRYPPTKYFVKLKNRFEKTANVNYEKIARTYACRNQDRQIDIVGCAVQNPFEILKDMGQVKAKFTINNPLFMDINDLFHLYDDLSFFRRFRLTRNTVLDLLPRIEQDLEFPYDVNHSLSPMNQLLITLMFYSSNSHMIIISDIVKITIALLAPHYIHFPRNRIDVQQAQNSFYEIASFPKVIGAVDGTHIRIRSPRGQNAEVISNARRDIIDLIARWPGSAHDATVLNSSNVRKEFENNMHSEYFLLGDSAYPVKEYLLTPLQNPAGEAEQLYNESHIRTRGVVEQLFGIWKHRFPILAYGSRLKFQNTLTVIVATGILHNIARKMGELEPSLPEEIDAHVLQQLIRQDYIPVVLQVNAREFLGPQIRRDLINNYFARL
ncbi:hypothetical protein NQ315_003592 [Exocentrus adspersus]|uniref:DDE Tnp4 domain-containing protein n=1 Tax=Exocentrus adspersus TaxID=1586481 RepID=A0AAV8VJ61_9CUCU|nr:hypothetical protein NQ315_003592 [Exocentrus adspersus]